MSWHDFLSLPIPFWWYELEDKAKTYRKTQEKIKQNTPSGGGFSAADWDKARELHRKKMDGKRNRD